jgi:PHD/YefM family antitoxin component YafN of YafNO toxin-antitoxin module
MRKVSMMQLRRSPGRVLDDVRYRDELVQLERDGHPVAIVISTARLERLERLAALSAKNTAA